MFDFGAFFFDLRVQKCSLFCSRCNHLKQKKTCFPLVKPLGPNRIGAKKQTCGSSSNAFKNGALSPRNMGPHSRTLLGTPILNASISSVLGPDFCSSQSPETPICLAIFMLSSPLLKTPQKACNCIISSKKNITKKSKT